MRSLRDCHHLVDRDGRRGPGCSAKLGLCLCASFGRGGGVSRWRIRDCRCHFMGFGDCTRCR